MGNREAGKANLLNEAPRAKGEKMKRQSYTAVAERVVAATKELNAALQEAYDHPQVRVHMGPTTDGVLPIQYGCEITRITKHGVSPTRDDKDARLDFVWKLAAKANLKKKPKKRVRK